MCCVILSPQLSCISRSLSDLGNRSENSYGRGQILSILQVNSCSIGQESGEIWTVQTDLQQIYPKSDRLLRYRQNMDLGMSARRHQRMAWRGREVEGAVGT